MEVAKSVLSVGTPLARYKTEGRSGMNQFEVVGKYKNVEIPKRSTKNSAGYDLCAAEDIIIPSLWLAVSDFYEMMDNKDISLAPLNLAMVKGLLKQLQVSPVLVPTGIKIQLKPNLYLSLSARSSLPLNSGLIVANAPGIIDADYYNNESNEGEIFIQLLNFSPFDISLKKGDKIAQGVILEYHRAEEDQVTTVREGGHGSTGE